MGRALMGTGVAKGQNRARLAAEMAVTSPLLDDISVEGATGVLINIVGGPDLKMREIQEAASLVQEQAHEDANIIFGASIDETLGENVKVTVIATGFDGESDAAVEAAGRAHVGRAADDGRRAGRSARRMSAHGAPAARDAPCDGGRDGRPPSAAFAAVHATPTSATSRARLRRVPARSARARRARTCSRASTTTGTSRPSSASRAEGLPEHARPGSSARGSRGLQLRSERQPALRSSDGSPEPGA